MLYRTNKSIDASVDALMKALDGAKIDVLVRLLERAIEFFADVDSGDVPR